MVLDNAAFATFSGEKAVLDTVTGEAKKEALLKAAAMPAFMFVCYITLIIYFKSQGGYKAEELTGHTAEDEKFTGGVAGPADV